MDATSDFGFMPIAEQPTENFGFVPDPATVGEQVTKAGYSFLAGGAQGVAATGKGLERLADPGPLANNYRNYTRSMLRAGADETTEENASASLLADRDIQRQYLTAPGQAIQAAAQPVATGAQAIATETPGNEHVAKAANLVGGMVPLLGVAAIPVVGPGAAAVTGGLQATGETYEQALRAYKQQGMSDEAAQKAADDIAIKTGINSGIVYSLLPGAGKATAEKLMAEQLSKASPTVQAAVRTLAQGADGSVVMGVNSLITSAQAMRSYNPDQTWADALKDAAKAAAIGFVASSAVHGAVEGTKLALGGKPAVEPIAAAAEPAEPIAPQPMETAPGEEQTAPAVEGAVQTPGPTEQLAPEEAASDSAAEPEPTTEPIAGDSGAVTESQPELQFQAETAVQEQRVQAMASSSLQQAARVPRPGPVPPAPSAAPAPTGTLPPLPSVGPIRSWFNQVVRPLQNVVAPQTIDAHAGALANILRENGGKAAVDMARADQAMAEYRSAFDKTPVPSGWTYDPAKPLPPNYEFLNKAERNRAALSPEHLEFAQLFDQLFQGRIAEVRRLAPNAMKNLITDYFPHIWKDPKAAVQFTNGFAAKPLHGDKSFLRERSLPYILDGLKKGLQPVSDNPADLLLMKLHQMDKFILAERTLQEAKQTGLRKYLPIGQEIPEGWAIYNDRSSTQHGPPVLPMREAFDAGLRRGLLDFIAKMGWSHERLNKVAAGVNAWGQYTTGTGGEIQSRYGGPDGVIEHELGHALDEHYGLGKVLSATPQLESELNRLAELRSEGVKTSAKFKKYALEPEERTATAVQAYLHAPELMEQEAPAVKYVLEQFINRHPELQDLNDIKPSLALAESKTEIPLPGFTVAGHWIMPEGATQVMNNYLSPGLGRFLPYRSLRAASNLMNAAQLGLSAFHLGFTSLDAAVSSAAVGLQDLASLHPARMVRGVGQLAETPIAPVSNYYLGKAVQRAMLEPGSNSFKVLGLKYGMSPKQAAKVESVARLAVTAGLRATVDPFYQTRFTRNVVRAFHEGGAVPYAKTLLNLPLAIVEQTMRPITEFLVPRQKLGVFSKMALRAMEEMGPGATHDQVRAAMAKAADSTENRMGQMTYDNLFYNKMVKDIALVGFRAYGWQLGKYREAAGAVTDAVGQAKALAQGKRPELTHRMAYAVALPMVVGAIGAVVHRMMTGQNPQTAMDYFFPQTGQTDKDGRAQRLMLPSYLKDLVSDWHDFPDLKKMGASFYHKLNPLVSTTVDLLRNRNFYDVEIRHEDDPFWKQQLDNVRYALNTAKPFSVTGMQRMAEEHASLGQYALPFFGITPAKKSLTMSPAEAKAAELMQNALPTGTRTQGQFDHAQLVKALAQDLRTNPVKGVQGLREAVASGELKRTDVSTIKSLMTLKPLQYQVHKLSSEDAMRVWDIASPAERQQIQNILLVKIGNSKVLDPETKTGYLKVLMRGGLPSKSP